jgi:hypothetical protein
MNNPGESMRPVIEAIKDGLAQAGIFIGDQNMQNLYVSPEQSVSLS